MGSDTNTIVGCMNLVKIVARILRKLYTYEHVFAPQPSFVDLNVNENVALCEEGMIVTSCSLEKSASLD